MHLPGYAALHLHRLHWLKGLNGRIRLPQVERPDTRQRTVPLAALWMELSKGRWWRMVDPEQRRNDHSGKPPTGSIVRWLFRAGGLVPVQAATSSKGSFCGMTGILLLRSV
jgi:hypothetical protein